MPPRKALSPNARRAPLRLAPAQPQRWPRRESRRTLCAGGEGERRRASKGVTLPHLSARGRALRAHSTLLRPPVLRHALVAAAALRAGAGAAALHMRPAAARDCAGARGAPSCARVAAWADMAAGACRVELRCTGH